MTAPCPLVICMQKLRPEHRCQNPVAETCATESCSSQNARHELGQHNLERFNCPLACSAPPASVAQSSSAAEAKKIAVAIRILQIPLFKPGATCYRRRRAIAFALGLITHPLAHAQRHTTTPRTREEATTDTEKSDGAHTLKMDAETRSSDFAIRESPSDIAYRNLPSDIAARNLTPQTVDGDAWPWTCGIGSLVFLLSVDDPASSAFAWTITSAEPQHLHQSPPTTAHSEALLSRMSVWPLRSKMRFSPLLLPQTRRLLRATPCFRNLRL